MAETLEQQRAADAWRRAQGCNKDYVNLAKGLPALIMNSGLMHTLAFLHEKGGKQPQAHCRIVAQQMREWLRQRFPTEIPSSDFAPFMESLLKAEPRFYQQVTAEAMAWLRWLRQMAAAANA